MSRGAWKIPLLITMLVTPARGADVGSWPVAGGDAGATRYSPLADIDRTNVSRLEVAWRYRHGDYRSGWGVPYLGTAFEATPILVEGRLVFPTPYNRVIALDPRTGRELWTFDPKIDRFRLYGNMMISRGVSWWRGPEAAGKCSGRIFLATLDARLIALDIATGEPCAGFGADGTVDLLEGIEPLIDPWEYNV
ncbi:MAG: PQQ-binding-like beta-propeller repeat protein, partial [Candidatus Binatia bacterium]